MAGITTFLSKLTLNVSIPPSKDKLANLNKKG
jgi:hypothetical protein